MATENLPGKQLEKVAALGECYLRGRRGSPVTPSLSERALAARLEQYDFAERRDAVDVATDLFELLAGATVRTDSPTYFGLFNPPALPEAIIGDLITAIVNPQLAVDSHAPGATAIERKLLGFFHSLVGWEGEAAGSFTSGGSEANHTAALVALTDRYPGWEEHGIATAARRPAIYCSANAHMVWSKIAKAIGLGTSAVRLVEAPDGLSITARALEEAIESDGAIFEPFLVVGTAGTTSHGAIDDLPGLALVARNHRAHFHVDAAWAGGALLLPQMRGLFRGIELADSITVDPHKMLSVPMGAGLYLGRDWGGLERAFSVSTTYMPAAGLRHRDPYLHSMQWSRRFIGLKLFMALAVRSVQGMRDLLAHQMLMGEQLREALRADGWVITNSTPLPLVCFAPGPSEPANVEDIASNVVASGEAWLSVVQLGGQSVLRACITSYETRACDIDTLLRLLRAQRG